MNDLKVKFLMGPIDCNDPYIPEYSQNFISKLSRVSGINITYGEIEEIANQTLPVYFIASGGAENGFKENYLKTKEPYILLTTPSYNSLAAAMEIMGFLQENNLRGEILHGDMKIISDRLNLLMKVEEAKKQLSKSKIGCFGLPGGLIASDADFKKLKEKYGLILEIHELNELIEEYKKGGYEENEYTKALKGKTFNKKVVEEALNVYGALKRLIIKYDLQAVTVRCFDLLSAVKTTGCLALALLNVEGIPATCEGDQKTVVSMLVSYLLTGKTSFMANPSCMDSATNEIIFAHCTIPIDMLDTYYLTTHFESGIGVSISGDITPQKVTIFKCNRDLTNYYSTVAELKETMHRKDLCRTQMRLYLPEGTEYFTIRPISNHHIIIKGDYKEYFDEFFK